MKQFCFFIIKIIFIFLIILFLFEKLYTYVYFEHGSNNRFQFVRNQKNKKFNYLFIGSSRVVNNVNPKIIDSVLSTKSINLGILDAQPKDILTILKLTKQYNIKFQKIFIQTDYYYNSNNNSNFLYVEMLPFLTENDVIKEYYSNEKDFLELVYIPFYRYSKNNYKIGIRNLLATIFKKNNYLEKTKGFEPLNGTESNKWTRVLPKKLIENKYNNLILSYLHKNNLDYHFFIAPFRKDTKNLFFIDNLKKKNSNIIDFSKLFIDDKYFKNGYHLNLEGSKEFSFNFSEKIKNL